jgi:hypothetical protein
MDRPRLPGVETALDYFPPARTTGVMVSYLLRISVYLRPRFSIVSSYTNSRRGRRRGRTDQARSGAAGARKYRKMPGLLGFRGLTPAR